MWLQLYFVQLQVDFRNIYLRKNLHIMYKEPITLAAATNEIIYAVVAITFVGYTNRRKAGKAYK